MCHINTLKLEKGGFFREIGERNAAITNEGTDRRLDVEHKEKEIRFRLQTKIAMLKHEFEHAITEQPSEAAAS